MSLMNEISFMLYMYLHWQQTKIQSWILQNPFVNINMMNSIEYFKIYTK